MAVNKIGLSGKNNLQEQTIWRKKEQWGRNGSWKETNRKLSVRNNNRWGKCTLYKGKIAIKDYSQQSLKIILKNTIWFTSSIPFFRIPRYLQLKVMESLSVYH